MAHDSLHETYPPAGRKRGVHSTMVVQESKLIAPFSSTANAAQTADEFNVYINVNSNSSHFASVRPCLFVDEVSNLL
jgi:hypothetical protein